MKISISVPKPCHENWNAMTPAADGAPGIAGRHCDSCQHTVMDLTRVSDTQLIDLFRKDAMPKCARLSQGQLDRVITLEADRSPRLLPAAAVGLAMAFAAPDADAQNCAPTVGKMIARPVEITHITLGEMVATPKDSTDQIIEKVQMGNVSIPMVKGEVAVHPTLPIKLDPLGADTAKAVRTGQTIISGGRSELTYYIDEVRGQGPVPQHQLEELPVITGGIPGTFGDAGVRVVAEALRVTGRVLDENGEPAPFVSIRLENTPVRSASDLDGRFSLSIPDSLYDVGLSLRIHMIGYSTVEVPVGTGHHAGIAPDVPMYVEGRHAFTGRAMLNDKSIPGCIIEVVGTDKRIMADERGFFGFDVPDGEHEWTVRAIAPDGSAGSTTFPASALPCCVPIALEAQEKGAVVRPSSIDMGDIVLVPNEAIMMGLWIETTPAKQSLARRAGAPFRWVGRQVSKPFR